MSRRVLLAALSLVAGGALAGWLLWPAREQPRVMRFVPAPPQAGVVPLAAGVPAAAAVPIPGPGDNVHRAELGARRCLGCHARPDSPALLAASVAATCRRCHLDRHARMTHPVDAPLPPAMTTTLPLDGGRRMGCLSCHDGHGERPALLRRGANELCGDCHRGY